MLQARIDAGETNLTELLGRAAVASAKLAYAQYRRRFGSDSGWPDLAARGCHTQRPLWASTSTKNPAYRESVYVDTLIGPDTVNTVPPATLEAIGRLTSVQAAVDQRTNEAAALLDRIGKVGIDMKRVTRDLRTAGVKAFADSFDRLLGDIETKITKLAVR
jgi:transaldolase